MPLRNRIVFVLIWMVSVFVVGTLVSAQLALRP